VDGGGSSCLPGPDLKGSDELEAANERLRNAMLSIVTRCQQGWPHRNWQEEVRQIAAEAAKGGDS